MTRILFLILLIATYSSSQAETHESKYIRDTLSRLTFLFSDGIAEEYDKKPAVVRYGQIFDTQEGDKKPKDAVVLFGLSGFGGSNHSTEYIAFFKGSPHIEVAGSVSRPLSLIAVTKVAERGWRFLDWESMVIKKQSVTVSGFEMGSGDALCCPSAPIKVTFRINDYDQIIETTARLSKNTSQASDLK